MREEEGDRKLARYHFGTLVKKHSFLEEMIPCHFRMLLK